MVAIGVADSSLGSSVGATSSTDASTGAGSLVGPSVEAAWVLTGMVAQVCPSRDSPEVQHPPEWHHQRRPHMVLSPSSILAHTLPKGMVSPASVGWPSLPNTVGLCLSQSLLRLSLPEILVGVHWVWRWQEFLTADALGGQRCWIVFLDTLDFTLHSGELKRGLYLLGELPEVIYSWEPH